MGEAGNEPTAELRALDAPTQQLPALIPAMAHMPPDAPAHETGLARRWRWPLLAVAAAALASVPIALFATSDGPDSPRGQVLAPQWPPGAQAAPSPSPSTSVPAPPEVPAAPPPPPPAEEAPRQQAPSPSPTAAGPPSYEAEAPGNLLRGRAAPRELAGASGGSVVGWVGDDRDNTLAFTGVTVATAGQYEVTIHYVTQDPRSAAVTVNGRFAEVLHFAPTGGWDKVGSMTVTLTLRAGANTVEFGNPFTWAPDFDRLVLPG